MRAFSLLSFLLSVFFAGAVQAQTDANQLWQSVTSSNGSTAQARHESAAIESNGQLYLIGGRGIRQVQVFNLAVGTWTDLGPTPIEMHHFQPVAIGDQIYVIGALSCCFPTEDVIADIHVFNTTSNTWSIAGSMPASRARGSAGVAVYNNKIYVLGGNTLGHSGGAVPWFDEYDPTTQQWTVLADAPNARDHFSAVLINDYMVAASGRQTSMPNPFMNAVLKTDAYDFVTGKWTTAGDIPTARAGALAGAAGDEIIVAGGEINTSTIALNTVEAMNIYTGQWRALQPMMLGRHSGGGAVLDGRFHVIAGSLNTGGAPETQTHESLQINEIKSLDFDADGLSNDDERRVHGTDPAMRDTDSDNLDDDVEINEYMSDPLVADTDEDGIDDGVEVDAWGTDPTKSDTDDDGLSDFDEAYTHNTNALNADTDSDQLTDAVEINQHMTDPANTDTDADGLSDYLEIQVGLNPLNADSDGDGVPDGDENIDPGVNPPIDPDTGTTTGEPVANATSSSGGNVSIMLLVVILVGRLSRIRLNRVNVSSKNSFN